MEPDRGQGSPRRFGILTAFEFLTPFGRGRPTSSEELARSAKYFPLVGLGAGLLLVGADAFCSLFLPTSVVNVLLLVILAIYSGGLHLDGFCDTMDALAGGSDRESVLRIMRDSSVGAIGMVALVFLLMVKYFSMDSLPLKVRPQALACMPVAAYWTMVVIAFANPYARSGEGTGRPFAEGLRWSELAVATIFALGVLGLGLRWGAGPCMVTSGAFALLFGAFWRVRIGGVTGDVLGATKELAEVVFLVTLLISERW